MIDIHWLIKYKYLGFARDTTLNKLFLKKIKNEENIKNLTSQSNEPDDFAGSTDSKVP